MSEETQTKSTPADTNEGNNTSTISIVEKADSIVKRLEDAERRLDEKTARYEQLVARSLLSGKSEVNPQTPVVETAKEYADRIMRNQSK